MSFVAMARDQPHAPPDAGDATRADGSLDLQVIYRRHAEFVWLTLQRLGVREADAEDLAHEVFITAHRKLRTFDHSAKVTTWLFGICLRVAANYRRHARNRLERFASDVPMPEPTAEGGGPDELVRLREATRRLQATLDAMDLTQRAVFVMFEIEGIACGDIAETVGIPVGTVYSRLHAARKIIEAALRPAEGKGREGHA